MSFVGDSCVNPQRNSGSSEIILDDYRPKEYGRGTHYPITFRQEKEKPARIAGRGYNPALDLSYYGIDSNRKGFVGNIEKMAEENTYFRAVLFTSDREQLVLMSLDSYEAIGQEIHSDTDQFIRIESGNGTFALGNPDNKTYEMIPFSAGDSILIPAGVYHNVVAGNEGVKLYSIYSPPHHQHATLQLTKPN